MQGHIYMVKNTQHKIIQKAYETHTHQVIDMHTTHMYIQKKTQIHMKDTTHIHSMINIHRLQYTIL